MVKRSFVFVYKMGKIVVSWYQEDWAGGVGKDKEGKRKMTVGLENALGEGRR